jgi:hypothetical protein
LATSPPAAVSASKRSSADTVAAGSDTDTVFVSASGTDTFSMMESKFFGIAASLF